MEDLKKIVSKNIINLRTQSKMTQYELGEMLNYSDKAVSKWERAESMPDAYVLKKMGGIFNVSVDYLLNDNSDEQPALQTKSNNQSTITKITLLGVWTIAILIFILFWMFNRVEWMVFIYTLPVSLVVWLVLNSIWGTRKGNYRIISTMVWSVLLCIYLATIQYNFWALLLLGIPSQLIIYLSFKLHRNK